MSYRNQLSTPKLYIDTITSRQKFMKEDNFSPKHLVFKDTKQLSQATSLYQTPRTDLLIDEMEAHEYPSSQRQELKLNAQRITCKQFVKIDDIIYNNQKLTNEIVSCKIQITKIGAMKVDFSIKISLIKGIKEKLQNILQEQQKMKGNYQKQQQQQQPKHKNSKMQKTSRNSVVIQHQSFHSDRNDNYSFSNILYSKKTPASQYYSNERSGFKFGFHDGQFTCFNPKGFRLSTINNLIQDYLKYRQNYNSKKMISYDKFEETEAYQQNNRKILSKSFITITPFSYNGEEELESRLDSLHCSENIFESPSIYDSKKLKESKLDRYRQFIIQFHSDTKEMVNIFNSLKSIQNFIEQQIIYSEKELSISQKTLQDLLYEDNQKQTYLLQLQIVNQQIKEKEKIQKYIIKKQRQVSFMDLPDSPKDDQRLKQSCYYQQPTSTTMSTQISYQHQMTQSARLHNQDKTHHQNNCWPNNQSFYINNQSIQDNFYNTNPYSPKYNFATQTSYHKQLKNKSKSETFNQLQNKFASAPFKMQINNNPNPKNSQFYQHRHYPIVSQFN
ncbi:hypothetical protein TTHERM_00633220 (macronuclear) [Tetrahymena thermophila SB210]|uniref:Uncharacterized protein n=1 Tax=Tetrahymena thermophila (strain SB210) TaxID=312017 RepID=Q22X31_TETTS|nr:hypothetical protein TTHERM_00633220 [Tetrahymena thermophila SB210]EAR89815.1 hypothetical protein TTHERM_00633220 [Tetrahymena thermophila SB210]|eukprot:XP_001010060.1 hypothetical protein TTHERM_00633220 [Tetrahymena thermophila SB210]